MFTCEFVGIQDASTSALTSFLISLARCFLPLSLELPGARIPLLINGKVPDQRDSPPTYQCRPTAYQSISPRLYAFSQWRSVLKLFRLEYSCVSAPHSQYPRETRGCSSAVIPQSLVTKSRGRSRWRVLCSESKVRRRHVPRRHLRITLVLPAFTTRTRCNEPSSRAFRPGHCGAS